MKKGSLDPPKTFDMEIKPYDFPDAALLEDKTSIYKYIVWEPTFFCIVLGQGNDLEQSVFVKAAAAEGIPVYRRPSGGEAVVLSPRVLVISILKRGESFHSPRVYFNDYNQTIIRALNRLGIENLSTMGISDICIGEEKILGSSIYRDRDRVFYHAVLNRAEPVEMMERYLKHPRREPGYRKSRRHKEFVTSLLEKSYSSTAEEIKGVILKELSRG